MAHAVRTFRIFVSSTFNDLREERNALQKHVFPHLKQLCLARGTRFQAIDLRWGVPEEAGLDQRTMNICLDEIERCRRTSPRPNFVILLGDRYGWRPLPAVIPAAEFERLRPYVADVAAADLIDSWYLRDDNAVPPEFCLKARAVDMRESQTKDERDAVREAESHTWSAIETWLRTILTDAIARAAFTDGERLTYEASATEQEIQNGAMKVADASDHVFSFFREITNPGDLARDLAEALPEQDHARNFVDTREDGTPDPGARERQSRLKATLARMLPNNVAHYQAQWVGRRGAPRAAIDARVSSITDALARRLGVALNDSPTAAADDALWESLRQLKNERPEEAATAAAEAAVAGPNSPPVLTLDHIPPLCADVFVDLARIILIEIARLEERDQLEKEVDDHEAFGQDRARVFIGRASVLGTIANYISGTDARPLTLYGASGSGKSAVVASAASATRKALPHAAVIERFIGATPGSSDIRTLIDGLCRQITRLYGGDETTIPTDYRELAQEFPKRLELAPSSRPLVIFLDALDQLSDADYARNLIWLPAALPNHARLIVSTLRGECLTALERKLPAENLVALEPMPSEEADALLDIWLSGAGRTLQPDQRRNVLDKFARSGLPLYLKLAFEEARHWTSHGVHAPLRDDIDGIIRDLYAHLSHNANHGAVMVSRSLAYLAAARNGLSEDELLDVLTLDEDVFKDFEDRRRHQPPERRLPVVVWSRLFFDLEPYLTERAADGASLLAFYHRQLREVAEQDYLSVEVKAERHRVLADYFAARALFEADGGAPNIRKLSELPYQQTNAEQWEQLYATLTDFDFLEAKCTHVGVVTQGRGADARKIYGGVYDLQEDYRRALEKFPAD